MKFIKFAHLLQQKLRMRAATGRQVLVSALTVALSIFSTQNAEAYDWVTNVAGIGPAVTIDVNNIPTTDKDLKLGLAPLDNAEDADKVVYLYEVHARLFVNATGHDGTGIGLLDVGAPFAFRKNNNTLDILTNFINKPGSGDYSNKLQYNLARHGNSLFMDRSNDAGSDLIQTWSFTDANNKRGTDVSKVNNYFYLKGSPHKDIDSRGVTYKTSDEYYVVLKNFNGSNIQSVIDDKHSPFDIAKADGNGVPENAAVFILVTRQMLLSAFDKAAQYASNSNNIDATWLMKDEDFYRTNADHLLSNKDRAWKLQGGLKDLDNTFWPIGGTGASSNQYIGIGENDAWTDYNRYFVTKLPYNKTGALTQTVTLPKAGWYSFSVKGIGGQSSADCLFAHIVNDTYPEGTIPPNETSSRQYVTKPLQANNSYDNKESEAGKLNYRYDKERDMAYFSTVDGVEYFYKVIEGEDRAKVTGDGLTYGTNTDLHNSLNIAKIDDNGNITDNYSYVNIGTGKTASFTVNVPEEGYYILSYYLQGGTANISTNGQTKEIKNSGAMGQAALEFYLKENDNTFTINTTEGTISLDRIIVERGRLLYAVNHHPIHELRPSFNNDQTALADNDKYTIQNGNYSVNKDGITPNEIKIGKNNSLTTINNLGIGTKHAIGQKDDEGNTIDLAYLKNKYTDNELNLDISSLKLPKGIYRITVYAYNNYNDQDRQVWVGISDKKGDKYKPWYRYNTFDPKINKNILTFKKNTQALQSQYFDTDLEDQYYISFGSGSGWAPDIAYVTIQQLSDDKNSITNRPEIKFDKGQTKKFTVDDAKNGSYRLSLWYSSVYPTNISIKVNGKERNLTLDPSTKDGGIYENEIISAFTFIPLQEGSNDIEITNNENDIALENIEINPGINAEVELGRIFSKADKDKSVEVSIYVPENNAKVEFGVYKSNTEEPVIIDHFRASYLGGPKGLLLDDSQDDWEYAAANESSTDDKTKYQWSQCQEQNNQAKSGELDNVPVYLIRDFGAGKDGNNTGMWSTIALPFNMNRSQLYEAFGETVQVGYLYPSPGTTLYFKLYDLKDSEWADDDKYVIEAGKPYFIKVTKTANTMSSNAELNALVSSEGDIESGGLKNLLLGFNEVPSDEEIKSKDIKYYVLHVNIGNQSSKTFKEDVNIAADPNNLKDIKTDAYITDGKGVEYSVKGHDDNYSLKFVPVLYRTQIPNGVYTLSDGRFKFYTGGTQRLKGFRAYIEDTAPGYGPNSSTTAKPWYFENSTTGIVQIIENIGEDDVKNLSPTDKVYNLNGQQVNANELHRGIYIRNGRKFIVK